MAAYLTFAYQLQCEGWLIKNLELWGAPFDVSARDGNGRGVDFEVKFFAESEAMFELKLSERPRYMSVYSPVDYLLFRVFEAANQLKSSRKYRVAVLVISDYEARFEIPLSENWIDWSSPSFLLKDPEFSSFLNKQKVKYPEIDSDLADTINTLDEIWVGVPTNEFGVNICHQWKLKT